MQIPLILRINYMHDNINAIIKGTPIYIFVNIPGSLVPRSDMGRRAIIMTEMAVKIIFGWCYRSSSRVRLVGRRGGYR